MLNRLCAKVHALMLDQKGVTAIEYGLIAALIAVAAVATMTTVGTQLTTVFQTVTTKLGG